MKRSEPLIGLSREHHTALSLAQRARRVAEKGDPAAVVAMAALVRERFETDLLPHFLEEEAWLLPALAGAGQNDLVERTLVEHAELHSRMERLNPPSAEALLAFADCLTAHVRFEERILFPTAETYPSCLEGASAPCRPPEVRSGRECSATPGR